MRIALWAAALLACGVILAQRFALNTDMTVFLPPSTTAEQRLLVGQLKDGVASRLILVAVGSASGADEARLAAASRQIARQLRASGLFSIVNNGDAQALESDRQLLLRHRYLLSPAVAPARFSPEGLKAGLQRSLELLASPAGPLARQLIPLDPTGEMRELAGLFMPEGGPAARQGVWFSRAGDRALLVAETRAPGFDVTAQRAAIGAIEGAASAALGPKAPLELSGPGVFASRMRDAIQSESWRLSAAATVLVVLILALAYRSALVTAACAVPAAVGLLVGITAVLLGYGAVHGITVAFGATLIGEAVDYPSYLFLHAAPGETLPQTLGRIGPTLRLSVLTTVCGALTMALSSFEGLAQLGVLTIAGVAAAGATTIWVLPALVPASALRNKRAPLSLPAWRLPCLGPWAAAALLVAGLGVIAAMHERLWDDDLANLSPIPQAAKDLDRRLRAELGAPDVRHLALARGKDVESALQASESLATWLGGERAAGRVEAFEVPSSYLPSRRTQELRRAALPDAQTLDANLKLSLQDSPFRGGVFDPFLKAVETARGAPLLGADALRGSMLGMKVSTLLVRQDEGYVALAPLRGDKAPGELAAGAAKAGYAVLDLKEETNRLVNHYRDQSLRLFLLGFVAIAALVASSLRSLRRAAAVLLPVAAAVALDVALLVLSGRALSIFNLVALLLVVGVGLNYALFFERPQADAADRARTRLSVAVCAATTLSVFGCLAFSATPLLAAIGETVFLGCLLCIAICGLTSPRTA